MVVATIVKELMNISQSTTEFKDRIASELTETKIDTLDKFAAAVHNFHMRLELQSKGVFKLSIFDAQVVNFTALCVLLEQLYKE